MRFKRLYCKQYKTIYFYFSNNLLCFVALYNKNILNRLNERQGLTEEENKIIIATNTIHSILLKDYGLNDEDLVDEEKKKLQEIANIEDKIERELALISYYMKTYHLSYDLQDENERVLTKRFPTITIKSNIRYMI